MIDHVTLRVSDLSAALDFYRAALAPLGYQVMMEFPGAAGLGEGGKADFWLGQATGPIKPVHVAFSADRAAVDAFHAAALAAGGADNGAPGLRTDYHPHYYAAFVHDQDGNNVEVVCHDPPASKASAKRAAPAKKAAPAKAAARAKKAASAKKPAPVKTAARAKKVAPARKAAPTKKSGKGGKATAPRRR
jgi:catechol 2,3-dioxygenase-like lactoylglutathione lyase family enzyme